MTHAMVADTELIIEKTATEQLCYAPPFYQAELHLSRRLLQLLTHPVVVDRDRVQTWLERFMAQTDINLSGQQQQAVALAANQRMLIFTASHEGGRRRSIHRCLVNAPKLCH